MRLEIAPDAASELEAATGWYLSRSARAGAAFVGEFRRICEFLAELPHTGQVLTRGVRRTPFRRFPYVAVYSVEEDCILILAVMHQRRHPDSWRR